MSADRHKILYVSHNHPMFRPGGAEQYAFDLYRAMAREPAFEPLLLARAGPPVARPGVSHQGPPLAAANGDPGQYLIFTDISDYDYLNGELQSKPVLWQFLHDFLVAHQPDVVHFHHALYYGFDVLRATRNALPNAPIVFTLHDYMPICHRDGQLVRAGSNALCTNPSAFDCSECFPFSTPQDFFMRKRFIQSHLALVDCFVAPTAYAKERFVEWGIPAERILVEPYGVPAPAGAAQSNGAGPERPDRKSNRFAFFGQLTPYKGADVLLEAMKLLGPDFDGHLWLFGANLDLMAEDFQARMRELVAETSDTVTLAGSYEHADVLGLMREMDWIMVPSIWAETGPFVVGEAFHARRPVICSRLGGLAEKVQHDRNGLNFRRNSPRSLAAVMRRAASEPGLWQRLCDGISPPHDIDSHLAVLTDTYRRLLAARRVEVTG
jgi:glycosyltransferase involved in cell wall biosynthesis